MHKDIKLSQLDVEFDQGFALQGIDWTLQPGEHWLLVGSNGAGKSALAAVLLGQGKVTAGTLEGLPSAVASVSIEQQRSLIEAERRKDDADIVDVVASGTPLREVLISESLDPQKLDELAEAFGIKPLFEREFRKLSTGETRKALLVKALASAPELLVLDEPFEGLDADSHQRLHQLLDEASKHCTVVLVLNRLQEKPDFITHVGFVAEGQLRQCLALAQSQAKALLDQRLHLARSDIQVPDADPTLGLAPLDPSQPLVRLRDISLSYTDHSVIEGLDWTIEPGAHWQLSGPNGSGKTGLLSLITGDHPQCYVNDIFVFGFQRGSGESIWQIKQYIGYVSSALQWEYRVSISARNVIISGFYDSIGLYSKASDTQREIADQWLALLGMLPRADQPFNALSYGDQRMLLIARAMVKHPALLILDEPCLGLDEANRHLVLALIEKIAGSGLTTVLYVNHHANDKIQGIERNLSLTPGGAQAYEISLCTDR